MASLAEAAGWLFGWLLRNSAHATVLAGLVWVLERTVCRRLSPRWRYGLWLLVVARLLIPMAPGSALSLFNLFDFAPSAVAGAILQVLGLPSPVPVPILDAPHPLADTPPWFLGALALWVPGAFILAALLWRDQQRLQMGLTGTPLLDPQVLDLLAQSKAVMCVRRHVELVETPQITSPAITGWWRPRLLLPVGLLARLTHDEIRFLFLHELAHVKRADIALNWILAVVQILHWFNPVVWFALRRLLTVREEVCDDLVLRRCFVGAAREYGLTLIRLLEECAPRRLLPAYAGVLDDARSLRQRVRSIREFTLTDTNPWVPAAITVGIAVAGLTERPDHNALSSPTPSYAVVRGHTRPAVRGLRARPNRVQPVQPVPTNVDGEAFPSRRVSSGPSLLAESLLAAVRRALYESHASPDVPAAASESLKTGAPSGPAVVSAPGLARATVRRSPLVARLPAQRPYPLPPVSERGDILRPKIPAGEWGDLEIPAGRPLEVVPYYGRQADAGSLGRRRSS